MQPYRFAAFGIKTGHKLATKFYGHFVILQRVGNLITNYNYLLEYKFTMSFM